MPCVTASYEKFFEWTVSFYDCNTYFEFYIFTKLSQIVCLVIKYSVMLCYVKYSTRFILPYVIVYYKKVRK